MSEKGPTEGAGDAGAEGGALAVATGTKDRRREGDE